MYGGGGGQWPGQQQPTGYMQPQQTGYMPQQQQQQRPMGMQPQQPGYMMQQPTGMGMAPQPTGMGMGMGMGGMGGMGGPGLGGMRHPGGLGQGPGPQQSRFLSPNPLQMQGTGMMQPQPTGMMQPQPTGVMQPQPTGMMQPQPTGMMRPQMTGYSGGPMGMQPTGLMPQMTGIPLDPRMQLMSAQFLPGSQPYQGGIQMAGNMNFSNASMQPSNFQNQIQTLSQQQQGSKEPKIPWALSKDERKSYDSIFRAWDQKGTGFLSGDVAQEVFGQSGLDRDRLMQIWHLSDTENRGKLNLAEFHVAMGLIYRALNGNDIPEHLPPELVPPSARDLSESVDFLKDLLKRDANVRQSTGLNLPESGSNKDTAYGKTRSFHENPIQKQDAAAYKHADETGSGYKSSARHLDRRTVRYGGESPADDLSEMKRQLAQTQRMLDEHADRDDDDREVEKEMEDLRFRIKRVQDDIDYYNRRGGRDAAENRRKAERELLHLMHERLPLLERRLEEKDKKLREKKSDESRDRDRRNESFVRGSRYDSGDYSTRSSRRSDFDRESDTSRSQTPTQRDQSHQRDQQRDTPSSRTPPPPARSAEPSADTSRPAPAPPAAAPSAAISAPAPPSTGPPKNMTAEERQAWIRSEAQRRISERMRALGAVAPSSSPGTPDASVEQRLAADKAEAEAQSQQADAEAAAREEARRARLEEQRIEKERAAVSTIKSELREQEKGEDAPPAPVMQAAREEVNEQEDMLRRREEVLNREKEERLARFKRLEEEEQEAKRQEEAFKERQSQFGGKSESALPAPNRKGKAGPPPPPPTRSRAPAPPPVATEAPAVAPAAPPAPPTSQSSANDAFKGLDPPTPSSGPSTNPFHRMQPNGNAAPTTPGGTNPFYRQQQQDGASHSPKASFASSLPPPQRASAASPALASASPVPSATAPPARTRRAPDDDDDWGESEHGDHDEEDPDGPGSTSRATRQNLAAALFSGLVSTPPPSSSSPAPPPPPHAQEAPAAPAAPDAPPAPPAAPSTPAAPSAPAAPPASVSALAAGPADRGALLGDIRGGLKLRKAQTIDRSSAPVAGKVIGDASAPVQKYIPPPSPPAVEEHGLDDDPSAVGDDSATASFSHNPHRQSVDWANSLAAEQMHQPSKASAMPDEPSVLEEAEDSGDEAEAPEDIDGPTLATREGVPINAQTSASATNGSAIIAGHDESGDGLEEFDLSETLRVRTLYAYESQRDEDLSFAENNVILAHPAKEASSDWWYGTLLSDGSGKKGTFPRTYVASISQPKAAKALYDFEGSSPDEMNLQTDQELHVVDDEDESWWKVVDAHNRILIVPATYVELMAPSG